VETTGRGRGIAVKSGGIRRCFLTGLFVLIPIGASVLIVTWLFNLLDTWATPLTQRLIGRHIPGVGILITAVVILLTGVFSSNVIGRWILGLVDHLLLDVPVVKTIYNTMKQVMQAFSPGGAQAFRSVVLVAHPRTGALSLGFVTHELEIEVEGASRKHLSVYLPTNHLYLGDSFLFRAENVRRTDLSVEQGIQCIITAGATLPADLKAEPYLR
jgi:uncharacterized membrane protein